METNAFNPNVAEATAKDKKKMSKDEKAALAGVAGAATIIGGGVIADVLQNGEETPVVKEELIAQADTNEIEQEAAVSVNPIDISEVVDPIDPTDFTISDPIYANTETEHPEDTVDPFEGLIALEDNVNEIVDEILAIDEVDPQYLGLAQVDNFDEVGVLYTETGEELLASEIFDETIVMSVDGDLAMGDIDETFRDTVDEDYEEMADNLQDQEEGYGIDSLDFSDNLS